MTKCGQKQQGKDWFKDYYFQLATYMHMLYGLALCERKWLVRSLYLSSKERCGKNKTKQFSHHCESDQTVLLYAYNTIWYDDSMIESNRFCFALVCCFALRKKKKKRWRQYIFTSAMDSTCSISWMDVDKGRLVPTVPDTLQKVHPKILNDED